MLQGSILHTLQATHQPGTIGKRSLNFGVYYKNTLVSLCHALEDCILTCSSAPLVITAFQRGQWYLQEADRYGSLAEKAQQVVIMATDDSGFAEHPTSQRPNVQLVALDPQDPVAQEWHLVILAPSYSAMVLCQELSAADYGPQGIPTQDLERKFYGLWTFETALVHETMTLAIDHIRNYNPQLADTLTEQVEAIIAHPAVEQEDLGAVVARVVDYLQTGQIELSQQAQVYEIPGLHSDILDSNLVSNEIQAFLRMAQLMDQADTINPTAAAEVAAIAEAMGHLLDLPTWQLHRLRLAGLLHRMAPLQRSGTVLTSGSFGRYSEDLSEAAPSCPLVPGAQVLRTMPRLRAIATIISHQTEYWNGLGQPAGLAGDEIPLESRILGLVTDFQQRLAYFRATVRDTDGQLLSTEASMERAIAECHQYQATQWDPKLVEVLALLVNGLQQGLNLPVSLPKISAGLWLVDSHCSDDLLGLSDPSDDRGDRVNQTETATR